MYLCLVLFMVKITKKDDNSPVFSPTQRKKDKKIKRNLNTR